jgi:putative chitinase
MDIYYKKYIMLLKIGSKGDDVKKLQTKLGLISDGYYGALTATAVKKWQAANGLTADGIVGAGTWSKMFGTSTQETTIVKEDKIVAPVISSPSVGGLKIDKLRGHIPDSVIAQIPDTAAKFNITNNLRLAHFLAQCGHESGGFKAVSENVNYSAAGLKNIFGKYFPGNLSESYARNPQKIASRVYGNRMGNGPEESGDGYKFRGRGFIQLTGKNNYTQFTKFIGEDCVSNPDLVATKYPLASAAFFFEVNKLWSICDEGADDKTITKLTKRINGGTIGLGHRLSEFRKFYKLLS